MEASTYIKADDEIEVLNHLENLLQRVCNVFLTARKSKLGNVIKLIIAYKPKLAFTDIETPLTGFEIINKVFVNNCFPTFILSSTYNQYAVKLIKKLHLIYFKCN